MVNNVVQNIRDQHSDTTEKDLRRVTLWGLIADLGLSALKGLVGVLFSSQALVADAVHSLADAVTDAMVLVGVRYWCAPADMDHPHGHQRMETLCTFLIGVIIIGIALGLVYNAVATLSTSAKEVIEWLAFWTAIISILIKELLYRWNYRIGVKHKSSAIIANAWHHRSDALSSCPVALALLIYQFYPQLAYVDQIAVIIVAGFIFHAAWKITLPAYKKLIDTGASEQDRHQISFLAMQEEGVQAVHALRTRYLGSGLQIDLHVQVDGDMSVKQGHDIAGAVKARLLSEGPGVLDVLIHIEPYERQQDEGAAD